MATFFTADTHFGHRYIIDYCNRPFSCAKDMTEALISRWNETVGKDDIVWHLGDFGWKNDKSSRSEVFQRLNGKKFLIIGNHDHHGVISLPWADEPKHYHELTITEAGYPQNLVLFHNGIRSWNGMFRGSIQLYGHSHGRLPGWRNTLDVGVDCWDYRPVNIHQINERLSTLPIIHPERED